MVQFIEKKDLVEVENIRVIAERERSIIIDWKGQEVLIPKSQIGESSAVQGDGDVGVLVIPRWLARDRGLCR